ncbi:hypothetical protein SEA_CAPTAINREX_33 [Microbacterium phage CaptainRex]|nr:hypothetical protein SEA_LIBRIE_33 [Microbacterium phage Librie]WIC89864.1 hypothetical protein SEA_CAPTAINREX_33 [Microbacterium phage CaptainRex]
MGKKITLDFSKVEERSGWNSKEMPEGLHEFKIELVDLKDANDGTTMWTYGLRPTNPKYKTRLFPYYCKHQQNQLFKLRDIFVAAGLTVPKKRTALDPDAPVGKIIAAEVSDATGQYAGRSEIDGVYDRSIIDDEDQVAGDEDEVDEDDIDEEADEVEEDDEEYDEEEEGDEDELREEIEALTLAALRKRAKGLGIDTDGVKKDELVELVIEEELGEADEEDDSDEEDDLDDEDLGDEDLEDEEFDDEEDEEEEEPEPAPRRRAAARKPAAKAAPAKAAPARRVVKRR